MLITRETDYALRLLRGLLSGEQRTAGDLSLQEQVPTQFAYKILKKLERAGLIEITRGVFGGCRLIGDLNQFSLFDLMDTMEEQGLVTACMNSQYQCSWRKAHCGSTCLPHRTLTGIQQTLNQELQRHSLSQLLRDEVD